MPTMTRRIGWISALSALFIALAIGVGAGPAAAHESLVSSTPAEGEQLAAPPEQITLVFSDAVFTDGAEVVVNDASGRNWVEGELIIDGPTVVATVGTGMPAGDYQAIWKVVSGDGHPISALISFTVLSSAPVSTPTPMVTVPPTSTAPLGEAEADTASEETENTGPRPWQIGLITASVVAAGGGLCIAILLILRRRDFLRRHTPETDEIVD